MLSQADVEQKTFSTALRGYDLDEVDDFLDEVVATIKQMNDQLDEARAARPEPAAAPVAAVAPEPEPVEQLESPEQPRVGEQEIDESAIGRVLVAAQNTADKLVEDAKQEASLIVEDARNEAAAMAEERESKKREVEAEITALGSRVASVRSELSVLAGEVAGKLDDMDSVLEGKVESAVEVTDGTETMEEDEDDIFAGPLPPSVEAADEAPAPDDADPIAEEIDTPSAEEDFGAGSSDHLDDILTGVANDLQLDSDVEPDEDEDPDEPSGHWS